MRMSSLAAVAERLGKLLQLTALVTLAMCAVLIERDLTWQNRAVRLNEVVPVSPEKAVILEKSWSPEELERVLTEEIQKANPGRPHAGACPHNYTPGSSL